MPEWYLYLSSGLGLAALLMSALALSRSGRQVAQQELDAATAAAAALAAKMTAIESRLEAVPAMKVIHDMEIRYERLAGDLRAALAKLDGLESTIGAKLAATVDMVTRAERVAERLEEYHLAHDREREGR